MFKNIHPNSYNTVARAHTDTNGMQEFYFIWPLLKSSILTWIKYGYSSILYAQLVLPTVNNFNWKINTGCLDRDKKKWLKRSYIISKVEDIDTICCLYLEFRVHCNVVSEGYYVLFFVTKGILHIQVWSSKVRDTVNKGTCNMYQDKT